MERTNQNRATEPKRLSQVVQCSICNSINSASSLEKPDADWYRTLASAAEKPHLEITNATKEEVRERFGYYKCCATGKDKHKGVPVSNNKTDTIRQFKLFNDH